MAKNSFYYPSLSEEETITHHLYANQLENLPLNYGFEPFEGFGEFEDKTTTTTAASASQSHREAEKRRRDRINAQLERLRRLIPKSDKMDKAELLERAVQQVKDLKKSTSEISKMFTIPTEIDDINIECHTNNNIQQSFATIHHQKGNHSNDNDDDNDNNNNNNILLIKATFCCEDRPDLIPDIIQALKDLNLTIIGAEIGCLEGRLKSILLLYYKLENANHSACNFGSIKQSLMGVLTRIISWSGANTSSFRVTSKRQRFFFSS